MRKQADSKDKPPETWTSPEWEVFMFLGPPGHDEPAFKPHTSHAGGTSGAPQRKEVKKRKRQEKGGGRASLGRASISKATSGAASSLDVEDTGASPSKGFLAQLSDVFFGGVGAVMEKQALSLQSQAESMQRQADSMQQQAKAADKAAAAAAKKAQINGLRLQLQVCALSPFANCLHLNSHRVLILACCRRYSHPGARSTTWPIISSLM